MEASTPFTSSDIFVHVRILLGVVVSLSIARLLSGVAVFVQHPGRQKPDAVHLLWVLSMLLTLAHFWWWQIALEHRNSWSFGVYAFVLLYATLNFLLCAILFPNDLDEYLGYGDYFISRRIWFFSLLALGMVVDVIDTRLKGHAYLVSFGGEYFIRLGVYLLLFVLAATIRRRSFHLAFALGSLLYEISWILRVYDKVH